MSTGATVRVTTVQTALVDSRLPDGELLVEVLPNGEVHIAYREDSWQSWPPGTWVLPD
jgi:hypothetical protein